jgi:magnesium chelatase subunit H
MYLCLVTPCCIILHGIQGSDSGGQNVGEPCAGASVEVKQWRCENLSEAEFSALGRSQPQIIKSLLAAKELSDASGWQQFQSSVHMLKLQRTRVERELQEVTEAVGVAERDIARKRELLSNTVSDVLPQAVSGNVSRSLPWSPSQPVRIVLMTGFESFNVDLYKRAAEQLRAKVPGVELKVSS